MPRSMRKSHLGLCLIAAALPAPLWAQDALVEVIVRGPLPAFRGDTAFSGVSVTRAEIEAAASLDEAIRTEAQGALFRRQSSLSANPTIQGLSFRAIAPSGAGRALVTLEGIPQNDPFGGWVIWAALPQDAIDQIRIVRGAGGGAYGAGALTGIAEMRLRPSTDHHISARLDLGENGSSGAHLGLGHGGAMLYYSDQTQYGDAAVRDPQRGAADAGVYGRDRALLAHFERPLCASGCANLGLLAGHYESQRDTGLQGATATATGAQYAISLTRPAQSDQNGYRLQLWYKTSDLSNRSVSVLSGRSGTQLANDQIATPASGLGFNAALRHQTPELEWEIGLDARQAEGEAQEFYRYMSGAATRYRVAGGQTVLAGVYGQGTRNIGDWAFTGALRIDQWRTDQGFRRETDLTTGLTVLDLAPEATEETVASARLGLTYALSARSQWRLAAYSGFRPPSLNELYRPFRVGNDVTEANSALRPETLSGIETGWRYGHEGLTIDLGLFYNNLRDPITNVTIGAGPATFPTAGFIPAGGVLRQRQNTGRITAWGLEAAGRLRITDDLTVRSSLALTRARLTDAGALNGKRPAQAPAYVASIGAIYDVGQGRLGADWVFIGKSFEDDTNSQPLKAANKLRLSYDHPLTEDWSMALIVDNALDSEIEIQRTGDGTLSYDNRRTVTLSLRYRP